MPECLKRLFVGIFPTADSLDAILAAEKAWYLPAAKWVPAEKRHLTLCFLGAVQNSQIPEIVASLRRVDTGPGPLRIELAGLGVFPNLRRPQVLWTGILGDSAELTNLAEKIQHACAPWMEKLETKPYRPHLTIARLRKLDPRFRVLLNRIGNKKWSCFEATEFQLIESRPNEPGSPYIAVETFPISKPDS